MKKLLLVVATAFAINFSAQAQADFRKIKIDVLVGYAAPTGSNVKGGAVISIEPKINLSDKLALGIKGEYAALQAVKNTTTNEYSGRSMGSILAGLEYSFGEALVRPFIGVGAGLYFNGSFDQSNNSKPVRFDSKSSFGFAPRAGIQFGHFRAAVEYNIIPTETVNISNIGTTINNIKNDYKYFSIKAGFTLGGGKK